jgi:putative transposase
METLNMKGMFQNPKWSPKLQKIALYKLIQMIKYKAEWYGKKFIQIDRFYPSSQKCSNCEYQYTDLTLEIRKWTCPKCKTKHHRDVNAAKNILNEGKRIIEKNIKN